MLVLHGQNQGIAKMKSVLVISLLMLRSIVSANFAGELTREAAERNGLHLPPMTAKDEALLERAVHALKTGNYLRARDLLEETSLSAESKSSLVQYVGRSLYSTTLRKKRSLLEMVPMEEGAETAANKASNNTLPFTLLIKPEGSQEKAKPYKVVGMCVDKEEINKRIQFVMGKLAEKEHQFLNDPLTLASIQKGLDAVQGFLNNLQEAVTGKKLSSVKMAELMGFLPPKSN